MPSVLTIRSSQLDALGVGRQRTWADQMVSYISHDFPNRFQEMGEPGARKLIAAALQRGGEVGIESESGVAVLIDLMIAFGEQFERSPDGAWARRMMANREAHPDLRVHLMRERMMATTQGRVVVAYRPELPKG